MAGHDDDPARLEPPVQLGVADRKAGHPQPEEEGAFRAVDADAATVEPGPQQIEGALRPLGVVRADDIAAEREHFAALDQIRGEGGTEAPRREAEDGVGRSEGPATISSFAITIPVRSPGSPSFERLMQRIVSSFQVSVASP